MRNYRKKFTSTNSTTNKVLELLKKSQNDEFSAEKLLSRLSDIKKRNNKKHRNRNPFEEINHLLAALHGIGYLIKKKNNYIINPEFICRGKIKFFGSGSACVLLDDGYELPVRKEDAGSAQNGDAVMFEISDYHKGQFYARVTAVQTRSKERHLARIDRPHMQGLMLTLLDTPGNIRVWAPLPRFPINTGYYAFIAISDEATPWGQKCEIQEAFPPDDESYDAQRIIVKHGLPDTHKRYRELQNIDAIIQNELPGRKDYRNLYTITIDGESAKDFDDAISLEDEGSCVRLYVHIADVSSFVKKGSPLDKEALIRGNSYYIGNRVVPMLPEILSNEYCSLKAGVDRLTLSAELLIDEKGVLQKMSFHRGVINVNRRLTYNEADAILTGKGKSEIKNLLQKFDALTLRLKQMRMNRGRVDLNIPNEEIIYDNGRTADILFGKRLISHRIIEECMLSANEAASKILREAGMPTLYRIHETISEEKLSALISFFRTLGLRFDTKAPVGVALQHIIDAAAGREYEQVVNLISLRSFMQAYYGSEPVGHFGLGFRDYTHFTSPIRRYPDLVVHRCIKALLDGSRPPYNAAALDEIGEKTSATERVQMKAERDYVKLKACRLMNPKRGEQFDVVVTSVSRLGLNAGLIDRPIEGMVPLWTLTDDYYLVNEDEFTVVGKRLGRRFRIGDKLRAVLLNADIDTMHLDFKIV